MKHEALHEGVVRAENRDLIPPVRYHYMDNLRAIAMLAGIFFHAALAYSPLLGQVWLTADTQQSGVFDMFAWFSHLFRMPLFFLISGFFACYLVDKRGVKGFLANRALRILIPFVVFLPLIWISMAMGVGWALKNVENPSPMLGLIKMMAQVPDAPAPPMTTAHLWFLYVLLQFGLLYAALHKSGLLQKKWLHSVTTPRFITLVLPLLMVPALLQVAVPMPAPEQFVPQLWAFGFFGLFFLLGALLFRDRHALDALQSWGRWLAISGVGLFAVYYYLLPPSMSLQEAMAAQAGTPFSWSHLAMAVLEAYISVHMTVVCLIVGKRLLNKPSRAMRLVADSSYWVYIIHLPVLFMLQFWLLDQSWNLWVKFLISSLGTLGFGLLTYLLLVRWTPIGWLLNGRLRGKN